MAGDPRQSQEPARVRRCTGDPACRARYRRRRVTMKIYRKARCVMNTENFKPENFKPMTVYTIYIASTPEKVWEALTSTAFSRNYFFGNSVEVDQRVGGAYIVRTPDGALHISGEVIECG